MDVDGGADTTKTCGLSLMLLANRCDADDVDAEGNPFVLAFIDVELTALSISIWRWRIVEPLRASTEETLSQTLG